MPSMRMRHPIESEYTKAVNGIAAHYGGLGMSSIDGLDWIKHDMPSVLRERIDEYADILYGDIPATAEDVEAFRDSFSLGIATGAAVATEAYAPAGVYMSDILDIGLKGRNFAEGDASKQLLINMGIEGLSLVGAEARRWMASGVERAPYRNYALLAAGVAVYSTFGIYEMRFRGWNKKAQDAIEKSLIGVHDVDWDDHLKRLTSKSK